MYIVRTARREERQLAAQNETKKWAGLYKITTDTTETRNSDNKQPEASGSRASSIRMTGERGGREKARCTNVPLRRPLLSFLARLVTSVLGLVAI